MHFILFFCYSVHFLFQTIDLNVYMASNFLHGFSCIFFIYLISNAEELKRNITEDEEVQRGNWKNYTWFLE